MSIKQSGYWKRLGMTVPALLAAMAFGTCLGLAGGVALSVRLKLVAESHLLNSKPHVTTPCLRTARD